MAESEPTRTAKPQPRIGSYQLVTSLGSGGMSSVFKAVHVETGHVVALKVLPRALAKNITLLQRFLREAKSAEALEHPNIVSIYDRGVDQGRYYLVLEYVEGGDLHDRVRNGGPLGIAEATAVIRAVCRGLQFAASRGLIHRDIKPANILMTSEGVVKIIDLGLALQAESEDERVTREGTTVGTVDYMAPEQARDSRATSERSDMYSLGCTFYFLLTSSPPFPGGDVADKLSRHCLQPPPDPRLLRPEIPAPLALLMQRMMAKRPENRFADYEALIDELDAMPTGAEATTEVPLYALIDDEDDDDEPGAPPPAPAPAEPALFALIDEDDDDRGDAARPIAADVLGLLAPEPSPAADRSRNREITPLLADVSMAELASLTDEPAVVPPPRKSISTPTPRRRTADVSGPLADALLEDQDEDPYGEVHGEGMPGDGPRRSRQSTKKLVTTYALIGLALVLLVIGSHQLIRLTRRPPAELAVEPMPEAPEPTLPPEPVEAVARTAVPPPKPPRAIATRRPPAVDKKVAAAAVPAAWAEPADPPPAGVPESSPAAEDLLPAWAREEVPERLGNRFVTVRRIVDPGDKSQVPSLALALQVIGGTVELADNGPFFEDDLRVAGDSRLVRSRPGYRPIVVVEPPQIESVGEQRGVVLLDGKSLILDGVDLVVNVGDLPRNQRALFFCRGGSLTLRRCTVTIVNAGDEPFDFVRTEHSTRPSRIRLDRTLVRGSAYSAFNLGAGPSEVVVNGSLVAGGRGSLINTRPAEGTIDARLYLLESLLCGRGPIVEVRAALAGKGPGLLDVKAFGTTFANLAGHATTSLVLSTPEDAHVQEQLRWSGDENLFAGWHDWCSSGPGRSIKLANLAAARAAWPAMGTHSREDSSRWNLSGDLARLVPSDLGSNAEEARPIVARVAAPSPELFPKSLGAFERPEFPPLAPVEPIQPATAVAGTPPVPAAAAKGAATAAAGPASRDLAFDLQAAPWQGDLGLFLRDNLRADDRRVRVLVTGGGGHYCSPFQMPEGVSLEVRPNPDNPAGGPAILWSPRKGGEAKAMIDVRGGDLVLAGVRLSRDASAQPRSLIRVRRGHLVLAQCWLIATGELAGGGLVEFRNPGTEPMKAAHSPFRTPPERPTCVVTDCLFISGGNAFVAELGRGAMLLSNCAVAAGNDAFLLLPGKVARSRFDATLCLDHCTIAAERSFVHLGEWRGSSPGPDRPWLLSTKDSAFVSSYDRPAAARDGVLLRAEGDSLAKGTLFWQSVNGAYDVGHFATRGDAPLAANRRADLQCRQWVQLWGASHMHKDSGPTWSRGTAVPSVRLYEKLASGRVAPADLELDPGYHPGRTRLSVGANLARLQIKTTRKARRP